MIQAISEMLQKKGPVAVNLQIKYIKIILRAYSVEKISNVK